MTAAEPRHPARCRCVVEPVLDDTAPVEVAAEHEHPPKPEPVAEPTPAVDLDEARADIALADPQTHDTPASTTEAVAVWTAALQARERAAAIHLPALLALVEQQAADIERLRAAPVEPPPLPTTEDYRVVLRDENAADEPSGGWQQIGSTVRTQGEAEQQMATRRRFHPGWPEMAIWRRQHVWSVAAVETRDASRAPESPAGATAPNGPGPP